MKILSIDGSTKSTGYAIIENNRLVDYGDFCSKDTLVLDRIVQMTQQLQKVLKKHNPTVVAMQDILPQQVRHNQKTYTALMYLQASIVLMCHSHDLAVSLCTASHWRKVVGIKTGRGVKRDTLKKASIDLVQKNYGIKVNDDVADAVNIGFAYDRQHRGAF